ncbi:MAG: hypothetical protein ACLFRT_05015 [Actinomycetota bacterium]
MPDHIGEAFGYFDVSMVDPSAVHQMLDELRFDEAEELAERGEREADAELLDQIAERREAAEERARTLAERIIELGDEREFKEIVDLAHDPDTRPLIDLLPDTYRKRPDLYLREAIRWEQKRREISTRRLAEARKALDGLDLELARGLMNRVDSRFLTEEQKEERDQLLLDISARTMELESLDENGDELIEKREPGQQRSSRRPWWRRWLS